MYVESAKANVAKEHCESKLKLTRASLVSRGKSRNAQKMCAVTIVGTVLKRAYTKKNNIITKTIILLINYYY